MDKRSPSVNPLFRGQRPAALSEGLSVALYPRWICQPCGERHGRPQLNGTSTWHTDPSHECGWCGTSTVGLTSPEDFGNPPAPERRGVRAGLAASPPGALPSFETSSSFDPLLAMLPPSLVLDRKWLTLCSSRGQGFHPSEHSGHWCIPVKVSEVDASWAKITALVKRGRFLCAKVSTAGGRAHSGYSHHLILVHTPDWGNRQQVNGVRETLRKAGFAHTLGYRRDLSTASAGSPSDFVYSDF